MAEVRPIDANAILTKAHNYYPSMDHYCLSRHAVDAKDIESAPTLDYAPVRHGHWIHCARKSNLWYCSECGGKILYNPTRRTYNIKKLPVDEINRFCRSCGAKMDGGNTDA